MIEKFAESIYNTVVRIGVEDYKRIFENLSYDRILDSWKEIKIFYDSLSDKEKDVFFQIVEIILINTTSHIFGILDGPCGLVGGEIESNVFFEGEDLDHEMQDLFLEYVQSLGK